MAINSLTMKIIGWDCEDTSHFIVCFLLTNYSLIEREEKKRLNGSRRNGSNTKPIYSAEDRKYCLLLASGDRALLIHRHTERERDPAISKAFLG